VIVSEVADVRRSARIEVHVSRARRRETDSILIRRFAFECSTGAAFVTGTRVEIFRGWREKLHADAYASG
jgi:hypothetical protein